MSAKTTVALEWVMADTIPISIGPTLPVATPGIPPYKYDLPGWTCGSFGIYTLSRKGKMGWVGKRFMLVHIPTGLSIPLKPCFSLRCAQNLLEEILSIPGARKYLGSIRQRNDIDKSSKISLRLRKVTRKHEANHP